MSETPTNPTPAVPPAASPASPSAKAPASAQASAGTPGDRPAAPQPAPASPAPVTPAAAPAPKPAEPVKFTSRPMRIGVYHFLNVQPLTWEMSKHHKIIEVAPNQMSKLLKEGKVDVAIAPIGAYIRDPSLQIVPIAAVGCKGPVKSVRLISNEPLSRTQRLFVDDRSETSVLLARLILKKWYGVKNLDVKPVDMASFHPQQVKPWEAVLQFGDLALESAPSGMTVTDLGEEWFLRTQKPFVFAVWMTNSVPVAREIEQDLLACRNEGVKHFQEIADSYSGIWVFHRNQAKEYLEKNIRYEYGPEEVKGHQEFQRLLKEEGLIF